MEKDKEYKLYFAPVQGVTDWIYRNLHEVHFGGVEGYYTPFIRVEKREDFRSRDKKDVDPELNRVAGLVPQVIAGEAEELRLLLEMLQERGYRQVDINLGCPFSLLVRRGKGAGLLPDPGKVAMLFSVLPEFPGIRCSVKMRLGWDDSSECIKLLPVLEGAGIVSVTLHARLGIQEYRGEPDQEAFARFYEACSLPLLYNGDLCRAEDIHAISRRFPALEGMMIGRGLLADPGLALEYKTGVKLSTEERRMRFKAFHDDLFAAYTERMQGDHQLLMRMKTLWEYFLPETDKKSLKRVKKATKIGQYKEAVNTIL